MYYNDTKNLPGNETLPQDLIDYIKNKEQEENPQALNTIWVSCQGANSDHHKNMGQIDYIPKRGFPGYYYPFVNTPGYLSPLVAIKFKDPKRKIIII